MRERTKARTFLVNLKKHLSAVVPKSGWFIDSPVRVEMVMGLVSQHRCEIVAALVDEELDELPVIRWTKEEKIIRNVFHRSRLPSNWAWISASIMPRMPFPRRLIRELNDRSTRWHAITLSKRSKATRVSIVPGVEPRCSIDSRSFVCWLNRSFPMLVMAGRTMFSIDQCALINKSREPWKYVHQCSWTSRSSDRLPILYLHSLSIDQPFTSRVHVFSHTPRKQSTRKKWKKKK